MKIRFVLAIAMMSGWMMSGCTTTLKVPEKQTLEISPAQAWAKVLNEHVNEAGQVDFEGVKADPRYLRSYVEYVAHHGPKSDPTEFKDRNAELAFYLNAYNALSMYNIIESGIPKSLGGMKKVSFFYFTDAMIDGTKISFYDFENKVVRPIGEERVHFALNCMSKGCPCLPRVPFSPTKLDDQLAKEAATFFNEERNVQLEDGLKTVHFSEILKFYQEDFLKKSPTLIAYANQYRTQKIPDDYKIVFIPYDWTVNAIPPSETKVAPR
jgi:hypothetical protein